MADQPEAEKIVTLTNVEIQKIIPHRFPFLLIDKKLEVKWGKRTVAFKIVMETEQFFRGHLPGQPVWPGVLVGQSFAQGGRWAWWGVQEDAGQWR